MPDRIDFVLLALRLARGLDLATSIAIFGALFFAAAVARPGLAAALQGGHVPALPRAYLPVCLALKVIAAAIWLPAQAIQMGGDAPIEPSLVWLVATDTVFGHALFGRTALAAAAVLLAADLRAPLRVAAAAGIAAVSLALQARLGHGVALEDPLAPILLSLHVLAAGAWLGGLPPLAWLILHAPVDRAAAAVRRFSWLGLGAVIAIAGSAWFLAAILVGGTGGWFGTAYGLLAIGKIGGFCLLLGIATTNKFVLTPRLAKRGRRGALVASIAVETVAGLAVIGLAAWLATSPPGAHLQPRWPFPLQPDLSSLDDPYLRKEIWRALALLGALALTIGALFWRRIRLPGLLAGALLIAWLPLPNLRLFAKPASATSFYSSETGFSVSSIARGEELAKRHCTPACFAPKDDPSELASYNIWNRGDGDFFGWLTDVFDKIGYSPFPHGTIASFDDRERWMLIDYFRARVTAGLVRNRDNWRFAIPAPALDITCADAAMRLSDLRGRVVHLIARRSGDIRPLPALPTGVPSIHVILTDAESDGVPSADACLASSADGWSAFAILAGVRPETLAGTGFLIDPRGWLRFRIKPGDANDRRDDIASIFETPFDAQKRSSHRH